MRKAAAFSSALALSTLALAACAGGAQEAEENAAPAAAVAEPPQEIGEYSLMVGIGAA